MALRSMHWETSTSCATPRTCIYRVSPQQRIEVLAYDPTGTRISQPTNVAFGGPHSQDFFVAHLGRWHISRIHLDIGGQPLANMQDESNQSGAQ